MAAGAGRCVLGFISLGAIVSLVAGTPALGASGRRHPAPCQARHLKAGSPGWPQSPGPTSGPSASSSAA